MFVLLQFLALTTITLLVTAAVAALADAPWFIGDDPAPEPSRLDRMGGVR